MGNTKLSICADRVMLSPSLNKPSSKNANQGRYSFHVFSRKSRTER
jgi:hypothetical protein